MKRLLVILAGLLAVGAFGAPTAAHAYAPTPPPYPPSGPTIAVSDGTVSEDNTVVFSGHTRPFDVVTINVTYGSANGGTNFFAAPRRAPAPRVLIGTLNADAAGFWSLVIRLTQPGWATLIASGTTALAEPWTLSLRVRVLDDGVLGGLAATGVASGRLPAMILSGVGAVLLGGLLVFGAVRWRRRTAGVDA
jgi:hypothetical protein